MSKETVTPAIASEWLSKNSKNRNIRRRAVQRLARDMREGAWVYTGEAIKFAKDGSLLDGQHRLAAVIESGMDIEMEVLRGLDQEAQDYMDTGIKRGAHDVLAIKGYRYTSVIAAASRIALGVEAEYTEPAAYIATHSEVLEWVEANPEIVRSSEIAYGYARKADVTTSVVAYSHYMMSKIDPEEADRFWAQAALKMDLKEGDPVLAMSWKFAELRRNNTRLKAGVYLSMIYRAWNARRKGKTMDRMMVRSGVTGERARIPELV